MALVLVCRLACLAQVSSRVRTALGKRDAVIADLRQQLEALQEQQAETEAVLERQRRELLGGTGEFSNQGD